MSEHNETPDLLRLSVPTESDAKAYAEKKWEEARAQLAVPEPSNYVISLDEMIALIAKLGFHLELIQNGNCRIGNNNVDYYTGRAWNRSFAETANQTAYPNLGIVNGEPIGALSTVKYGGPKDQVVAFILSKIIEMLYRGAVYHNRTTLPEGE